MSIESIDGAPVRVLVTGSNGQLGSELKRLYKEGFYKEGRVLFADRDILDICSRADVRNYFEEHNINVLINAAAYTAVDKAESEADLAFSINRDGVKVLAEVCSEMGVYMVHVSTDYVFDGNKTEPYTEKDATNPMGVYGASKLAGEEEVRGHVLRGAIVRTSWLYSAFGNNFVKTMLRKAKSCEDVHVVADQIGTPTWARDLAKAIFTMIQHESINERKGIEIFHYSNEGRCSWCEFAMAIMQLTRSTCIVDPISTEEYPTMGRRPMFSVLDKTKIKDNYGIYIPSWEISLEQMLKDTELSL